MSENRIDTGRLTLAPLERPELAQLCAAEADEELRAAYREMLEQAARGPESAVWGGYWAIRLHSGTRVGGLCFMGPPDSAGRVELGCGIDEPYRRRGYAAEAVDAVTRWALGRPGVTSVVAQTAPDNWESQRLLQRCGFRPAGTGSEGPLFSRSR